MFREMRRHRQQLPPAEAEAILRRGTHGVLAVNGDDGYPYAVPVSYVFDDGCIIFHGAVSGHKIESIRRDGRVSFCVVDRDEIVPEEYTTYFRSVIAFGRAIEVTDPDDKRACARLLADRYRPDGSPADRDAAVDREWNALCIVKIRIEHMTGKEAVELMRARRAQGEQA